MRIITEDNIDQHLSMSYSDNINKLLGDNEENLEILLRKYLGSLRNVGRTLRREELEAWDSSEKSPDNASPLYAPQSPDYPPSATLNQSPAYAPQSPDYPPSASLESPFAALNPPTASPRYQSKSPDYPPPESPPYAPQTPDYAPPASPPYAPPASPPYAPTSPDYPPPSSASPNQESIAQKVASIYNNAKSAVTGAASSSLDEMVQKASATVADTFRVPPLFVPNQSVLEVQSAATEKTDKKEENPDSQGDVKRVVINIKPETENK